ncbi:hypothetical protein DPMN_098369 [Dreissena polymorpha]|uniref:Uncharacterized protein n=1 Tax=Dreissena polymorpha TaxID=45954 RepID=A0A9D4LC19_DREPO|nr:hypothetical protein DPMN_098369 [Dreissena polymorpha]
MQAAGNNYLFGQATLNMCQSPVQSMQYMGPMNQLQLVLPLPCDSEVHQVETTQSGIPLIKLIAKFDGRQKDLVPLDLNFVTTVLKSDCFYYRKNALANSVDPDETPHDSAAGILKAYANSLDPDEMPQNVASRSRSKLFAILIEENANFRNSPDNILADNKFPSMPRVKSYSPAEQSADTIRKPPVSMPEEKAQQ